MKPLEVGVLGTSNIAEIHVREFNRAGARVRAILGRTPERAEEVANAINRKLSLSVAPFSSLHEVLSSGVDAVSICLPSELHLKAIEECNQRGIGIFCEKPLFWKKQITQREIQEICCYVTRNAADKLMINTSNSYFVEAANKHFGLPRTVRRFVFRFFTHGKARYHEIGVDLIPHALSLLMKICPEGDVSSINREVGKNSFRITFQYTDIYCLFHFRCDPCGVKLFDFTVNDTKFSRLQAVVNGNYQAFLERENDKQVVKVRDPFSVYIQNFLRKMETDRNFGQEVDEATRIFAMMGILLLSKSASNVNT